MYKDYNVEKLKKSIDKTRSQLNKNISKNNSNLKNPEILKVSKELDNLIAEYIKMKKKEEEL